MSFVICAIGREFRVQEFGLGHIFAEKELNKFSLYVKLPNSNNVVNYTAT